MIKQTSTVVYEFQKGLYGCSIFIGIGVSDLTIRKLFHPFCLNEEDGAFIKKEFYRGQNSFPLTIAVSVQTVILKADDTHYGVFFNINPHHEIDINTIAHEASHAADFIRYYNDDVSSDEEAYYDIAGCIARYIGMVAKKKIDMQEARKITPNRDGHERKTK